MIHYIIKDKVIFNKELNVFVQDWKIRRMNSIDFTYIKNHIIRFEVIVFGFQFQIELHKIYKPISEEELILLKNRFKNGKSEFVEFNDN